VSFDLAPCESGVESLRCHSDSVLHAMSCVAGPATSAMARSPQKRYRPADTEFVLRRVFHKTAFRPLQKEVIDAAIAGHDVFLCKSVKTRSHIVILDPNMPYSSALGGHGIVNKLTNIIDDRCCDELR
jgi:hypothetical protein